MEKITLKLVEFYSLDIELNGTIDPKTGQKSSNGLIGEKLSLTTKYWLTKLAKTVAEEKAIVDEIRNELIKKYGKEDGSGNISIPMVVDDLDENGQVVKITNSDGSETVKKKLNPDFQVFEKEFNEFLQTEKELTYHPFKLQEFEKVETAENYMSFFQLIKLEEEPETAK